MSPLSFRDPPRPAARCRYPIVLLHGLFGFVQKRFGVFEARYFPGVAEYLRKGGNETRTFGVHPWQTIEFRANQIKRYIEQDPELRDRPLNLIGHSMGGLDARYLVSGLGYGDRVKSITTLSTPHRGSPLADLAVHLPGFSRAFPAVPNLTSRETEEFNRKHPDDPRVLYLSVTAATPFWAATPFLWPAWLFIRSRWGENDGQVTRDSGRWGQVLEETRSDHIQLIGMRYGLNTFVRQSHLELFGRISQVLAEKGF